MSRALLTFAPPASVSARRPPLVRVGVDFLSTDPNASSTPLLVALGGALAGGVAGYAFGAHWFGWFFGMYFFVPGAIAGGVLTGLLLETFWKD